ncbi:MucBP domain-containing protein, partial [Lactococcus sp. S64]|uniref:lectin-like domain-containing protein n=1 Tax=Lactococcus sp. S64 TaxID=2767459 RepID=UPI00190373E0
MSRKNNIKKMLNSDKHERYRSYKRKKTWMYATITGIASILGGGSIAVPMIKADTISSDDSQAKEVDSTSQLLVSQKSTTIPAAIGTTKATHIDGTEYGANFNPNGSASITDDIATLTPDATGLAGNTILNTKVNMMKTFDLKGKVNLGDKSQKNGGADGVSFVFQPGDNDIIGYTGGSMGFGGIKGAFGFKLDTFFNARESLGYTPDPEQFGPEHGKGVAFGAFVDGTSGTANTISNGSKQISEPSNNEFKDIEVYYDGTNMTINYDGQTWRQDVSSFLNGSTAMSFAITASTGTHTNLQQFQLTSFDYTVAQGTVIAHYIDESGKPIADDVVQSGDLDTPWSTEQKEISNYTFKEVQDNASTTGVYTVNDQEVTYVYTFGSSESDSESLSDSTSDSTSDSESNSVSDSDSLSDSDSGSTSDSVSNSVSDSDSLSDSDSSSTSDSVSNSVSDSDSL